MRILQVIPSIDPAYGGTTEVFLNICRSLIDLGIDVEIASTNASVKRNAPLPVGFGDKKIHLFPKTFSESWKYSFQFKSWLAKNVQNFSLVHAHSVWSYLPSSAFSYAFKFGVPFFLSPHGMLSSYTFSRKPILKKTFWALSEGKMVKNTTGFFVSSNAEAFEVKKHNPHAVVSILPHGLSDEAESFPRQPLFLREKFGLSADTKVLLFFSRIHPKKGLHDILLPAIKDIEGKFVLIIAGAEDPHCPGFFDLVERKVKTLGLDRLVKFVGYVEPNDRWKYFDGADLFLLPSVSENFGIVVAEAMARGTPVLVSPEVQASELVCKTSGGLVVSRDVDVWSKAIKKALWENPLSKPSYSITWKDVAKQMIEFYNQFV